MLPIYGTTSEQHMKEDTGVFNIERTAEAVNFIESASG